MPKTHILIIEILFHGNKTILISDLNIITMEILKDSKNELLFLLEYS